VVEWLVVDDASTDGTAQVARRHGVDHVVSLRHGHGLARAFLAGLEASLKLGAHTIVNTDADNQYAADCIPALVRPILEGRADMVIGERPIMHMGEFSRAKKWLQRLGSWVVRIASNTNIADAPSGFRAIHRDAALRLNVFGHHTYTLETIIQAGRKNFKVMSVPVRVNRPERPSRLVRSVPEYVRRSALTILRIFIVYKPLRFFALLGLLFLVPAILLGVRYLYFFYTGHGSGHVQSLILSSILFVTGVVLFAVGVLSDLIAVNRSLLEEIRSRVLAAEIDSGRASLEWTAADSVGRKKRDQAV
jgi:glycosyltransferase involved in cell wall biosynthesis